MKESTTDPPYYATLATLPLASACHNFKSCLQLLISTAVIALMIWVKGADAKPKPQDSYGSPRAPAEDSYGSPQAPVEDGYGAPLAEPCRTEKSATPIPGAECSADAPQCTDVCNTVYEPKCEVQYEAQCKTVQDQKCETKYEDECTTVYEQKCSTQYDEQCETVYDEKCETGYETVYEDKCESV